MEYPEWLFGKGVSRQDMSDFLGIKLSRLKKRELAAMLKKRFNENPDELERYRKKFSKVFVLEPDAVDSILKCLPEERLYWAKTGKLAVVGCREVYRHGRFCDIPLYNRWQVEHLTQETLARWRDAEAKKLKSHDVIYGGYTFLVGKKYISLYEDGLRGRQLVCRLQLDWDIRYKLEIIGWDYPDDASRLREIMLLLEAKKKDITKQKGWGRYGSVFSFDFLIERIRKGSLD